MTTRPATPGHAGVLEAAALATEHLDLLVLGAVRDVHQSISSRIGWVSGKVAGGPTLPHQVHDGIATGVYAGISLGLRGAAKALRAADSLGIGPEIEETAQGRFVVSAVNGLIGDKLAAEGSPLAIEIGVRRNGRDVPLTPEGLAAAYPQASDALVVFVHGLCETEDYWARRSRPKRGAQPGGNGATEGETGRVATSYGARLEAEAGWSPVFVRANTGLTINETGVALSALLTQVVESWPTEVRRIALVGHSMGALIARAACAVSLDVDDPWTAKVTDVVTLGAPHTGSPVERTIARGIRLAALAPELLPLARVFEQRSAGVLDLHDGMPDDPAAVPHARYHLVAATLSRSPDHPIASTIGDYLVQYRSAVGLLPDGTELFPGADVLHVPGADHFDLLNHDDVYAALRGWLAR